MRKITWRLVSLFMVLVLMISVFPVTARAADEEWTEISNAAGLINIKNNLSGNYRLTADIDLAGAEWNPIGPFSGKLDGNSKVISNFTINDTSASNKGLFSSIAASGQVSNLGIENANITAGSNAGILAGTNSGTISRSDTKGSVNGYEYVGGLVGQNSGTIKNSFTQTSVSGKDYLGGLAGVNSGTVSNSYAASSLLASVFNNYLEFNGTPVGNYSAPNSGGYIDIRLEVTLTDNDSSVADLAAADFTANGITASPVNGAVLTVAANNGHAVTLTCNGYNTVTNNLTVNADTRTITGYYTDNSRSDTALTTTATVPYGTAEEAAKAGLTTSGYAKLSDNSYVAVTIVWNFDTA